jgi:hypothetical protein
LWVARDPADNLVVIAHVEIVITAATVLVGANKGERGGDSHVIRSERGSFFEIYNRAVYWSPVQFKTCCNARFWPIADIPLCRI